MLVKLDDFPNFRDEHKKCLKPPASFREDSMLVFWCVKTPGPKHPTSIILTNDISFWMMINHDKSQPIKNGETRISPPIKNG